MPKSDEIILQHMIAAIQDALDDTADMTLESFIADRKTARSVVFSLVTLGEGARQISDTLRQKNPNIEWRVIADTRNKLVHEYSAIDYPLVWQIVRDILPGLEKNLFAILNGLKPLP